MNAAPSAIILDINMPGGTGLAALKRLKQSMKTAFIPVLVLSGNTDPEVAEQARALGAAEFLSKPVDIDQLYTVVCRASGVTPQP